MNTPPARTESVSEPVKAPWEATAMAATRNKVRAPSSADKPPQRFTQVLDVIDRAGMQHFEEADLEIIPALCVCGTPRGCGRTGPSFPAPAARHRMKDFKGSSTS